VSGFVVWFTGLSGAGKSTLAALLASSLRGRDVHVEVLDGDEVRTHLSKGLTFSREDRDTNIRRIGFVAKLLARSGACAITAAISPFRLIRDEQRAQVPRFVEVYCHSSIEALAARDPKGLYRKALAGEIKGFTGIDDPYEEPLAPEVVVYTDRETKEESLAKILGTLEQLGYITSRSVGAARASSLALVQPHGGALVTSRMDGAHAEALENKAMTLPVLHLDAEAEVHVDQLATGAYSPLEGFLTSKDWLRVVAEMRLENGLPWPLPVALPISQDEAKTLRIGTEVALRSRDGRLVGTVDVSDVYCPEEILRGRTIKEPFGEADSELLRQHARSRFFVGGKVRVFRAPISNAPVRTPLETREMFDTLGLRFVAGLRTRGLPRRAEEYVARMGLEVTGGLLWQVLETPDGEPLPARLSYHEVILQKYFPAKRVVLSAGLGGFAEGPRAAILDAIICQNHGCSHVVLEQGFRRDVRDAFGAFAPGELAIMPLVFDEVGFCSMTNSMVTATSLPAGSGLLTLSEAEIVDKVARNEAISEEVVRAEVVDAVWRASNCTPEADFTSQ
jgi:adenylyl-sulfate kinase